MFALHTIKKQLLLIYAVLLAGLLLAGCTGLSTQSTPTEEPAVFDQVAPKISATGVIIPEAWTDLGFSTTGVVAEVLIEEGELVAKDQLLARLKGREELQAAIAAARFEVNASEKALEDLEKQAKDDLVLAQQAISLYAKTLRDAQYQLDNFTVPTNQKDLDPYEAVKLMREKLDAARAAFEPYKNLSENNDRREALKEDLDNAQSDYNAAVKRLDYVITVDSAQANLEKAEADYAMWKNGPDPAEIALGESRLENAQAALAAAEATLRDLELVAQHPGTVTELDIKSGEWVSPGVPVIQIADLSRLQIKTTDLNEIDAARVKLGDQVEVTFDALPGVILQGQVVKIAPKSSEGSGVNYTVVVALQDWPEALRWGMTAFVDIFVE
jgi:multidrug efflux pump subunit AcrA (membrane-fusion protein)